MLSMYWNGRAHPNIMLADSVAAMNDVSINFILDNNVAADGDIAKFLMNELEMMEVPEMSEVRADLLPLNGMEIWWFNMLTLLNIGAIIDDANNGIKIAAPPIP